MIATFLKTHGKALGTKIAPSYDIIFIRNHEQGLISGYHLGPILYSRYIDDICHTYVWRGFFT